MFLDGTGDEWGIQEPVVHALVPECDAVNVFASIHVPSPDAHPQFLGNGVLTPSLQQRLLEVEWS